MSIAERYVAIDNVCAWPILSRLNNGHLAVAIFNEPTHGKWEGSIDVWSSADDGRNWSRAATAVRHDPGTNRMNHAFGRAANGDLVVLVGGHPNRPRRGEDTSPDPNYVGADALHPVTSLSSDHGKTWRSGAALPQSAEERVLCPFGPIVALPSGTLLASLYDWPCAKNSDRRCHAVLYRSTDHGHTWTFRSRIASDDYNETAIHVVDERRVIAAARTFNNQTLHLYVSDDGGDSWSMRGPLSGAFEHNGHFLTLPDGRILLTYGIRHPTDLSLACRVSPDGGITWRRPHRLLQIDNVERYDGGYPSCVTVGDDTILTVYYARRSPSHSRYHMGAVLWNWREEFHHGFDK